MNKDFIIYNQNCKEIPNILKENSIDCVITDPPYELGFLGKKWDGSGIAFDEEMWGGVLKVMKPGAYLLAFGGTRTFHRMAVAIEDAGFEIRDTIMWLYGMGFPKSMSLGKVIESKLINGSAKITDIKKLDGKKTEYKSSMGKFETEQGYTKKNYTRTKTEVNYHTELGKQWQGWGTALKPSFEPIIVARKPFKGSLVDNVIKNGVGGINIDECRVPHNEECKIMKKQNEINSIFQQSGRYEDTLELKPNGRFPANTILTYDETDFDEVCGGFPNTKSQKRSAKYNKPTEYTNTYTPVMSDYRDDNTYSDSGSASRYFYCAKASKKDRDEGLEEFESKQKVFNGKSNTSSKDMKDVEKRFTTIAKNIHATVKPTDLMQYLVRLTAPKGATILDPFNGSGSTGKAVALENVRANKNYKYIGFELEKEYVDITKRRIEYALKLNPTQKNDSFEEISLFKEEEK